MAGAGATNSFMNDDNNDCSQQTNQDQVNSGTAYYQYNFDSTIYPAFIRMGHCDSPDRMASVVTPQYKIANQWVSCDQIHITDYVSIASMQANNHGQAGLKNIPMTCTSFGAHTVPNDAAATQWRLTVKAVEGGGDQVQLDEIALLDANQNYLQQNLIPTFGPTVAGAGATNSFMNDDNNDCSQQTNQDQVNSGTAYYQYNFDSTIYPAFIRMGHCDSPDRMASVVTPQYKIANQWVSCDQIHITDYVSIASMQANNHGQAGLKNIPMTCTSFGAHTVPNDAAATQWRLTVKAVEGGGDQVQLDEIALLDANQNYLQQNLIPTFGPTVAGAGATNSFMNDDNNDCSQQTNQDQVNSGTAHYTYTFDTPKEAKFLRMGNCDSPSRMATVVGIECMQNGAWLACNDISINQATSAYQANNHGQAGLHNQAITGCSC